MALTDGARKRWGRFIRQRSPLMAKIDVQPYSFAKICTTATLEADNSAHNVYHWRLHDPTLFGEAVSEPLPLMSELSGDHLRMPILFPRDFTAEWREARLRSQTRSRVPASEGSGDDLERLLAQEEEEERLEQEAQERYLASRPAAKAARLGSRSEEEAAKQQAVAGDELERQDVAPPQEVVPAEVVAPLQDVASAEAVVPAEAVAPAEAAVPAEDVAPPDQGATPPSSPSAAQVRELVEEQVAQVKQEFSDHLSLLERVMARVGGLEKSILTRSEEQFFQITQALASRIIGEQLRVRPERWLAVVRQTIAEQFESSPVQVFVAPQVLARLRERGVALAAEMWQSDPSLKQDEFRIEGGQTVVKTGLDQMIEQMVGQISAELTSDGPQDG